MAKSETSKKRSKSDKNVLVEHIPFQNEVLKQSDLVIEVLLDCIKENDIESFREVLVSHLVTANKTHLAKKTGLGRRTIYDLIDPKIDFNPGIRTIGKLMAAISEE